MELILPRDIVDTRAWPSTNNPDRQLLHQILVGAVLASVDDE